MGFQTAWLDLQVYLNHLLTYDFEVPIVILFMKNKLRILSYVIFKNSVKVAGKHDTTSSLTTSFTNNPCSTIQESSMTYVTIQK